MDKTEVFISKHLDDDANLLALHAGKYPEVDMEFALRQIAGKQKAKLKIPSWHERPDIFYPKPLALEQCSSEATARYKSSLARGESMIDLTGGFGVDCAFLAVNFKSVHYVEQQPALCDMAAHNFKSLNLGHIEVHNDNCNHYLQLCENTDFVYIDPARRNADGRKVFLLEECEPDILNLTDLLLEKAKRIVIKLSPMIDLSAMSKSLKHNSEIHVVAVNNECKEVLAVIDKDYQKPETAITAVNITSDGMQIFSFTRKEEGTPCKLAEKPLKYLYEPNAAILKAGAFTSVSERFLLLKLHQNTHLYTSDTPIPDFPGRVFEIEGCYSFSKKDLKTLSNLIDKANVSTRNFPASTEEIRKQLKLKDGGECYLFACTLKNGSRTLIKCKKLFFIG